MSIVYENVSADAHPAHDCKNFPEALETSVQEVEHAQCRGKHRELLNTFALYLHRMS